MSTLGYRRQRRYTRSLYTQLISFRTHSFQLVTLEKRVPSRGTRFIIQTACTMPENAAGYQILHTCSKEQPIRQIPLFAVLTLTGDYKKSWTFGARLYTYHLTNSKDQATWKMMTWKIIFLEAHEIYSWKTRTTINRCAKKMYKSKQNSKHL